MVENLRHAAWNRQSLTIAGGVFTPAELVEAAHKLEAFDEMLRVLQEAELVLAEKLRRLGAQPEVSPTYRKIQQAIARATKTDARSKA